MTPEIFSKIVAEIKKATPDWAVISSDFKPHSEAMKSCIQDHIHHAEGDVWTHTMMVHREVCGRKFSNNDLARLAALYHDVSKPQTRIVEFDPAAGRDRVRYPSHARRGARQFWHDAWSAGFDTTERLAVYHLIDWHQRVFHMIDDDAAMERRALTYASLGRWDDLVAFARADMAGRTTTTVTDRSVDLDLLEAYLREKGLWDSAPAWSDEARLFYLEKEHRNPSYEPQAPEGSRVHMLCGLPGAGKDTFARENLPDLPVVSLDDIRRKLRIRPTDDQGQVRQEAREQACVYLRQRQDFVWNATNVTRMARSAFLALCRQYDARTYIHVIDRPRSVILRQNRERDAAVPEGKVLDLALKFDPPSPLEAHEVHWHHSNPHTLTRRALSM